MKLQARLLLVYTALFIGAAGVLVLQRTLDIYRSRAVLDHELQNHHVSMDKIMSLEGKQLESLAIDYSYWDDMVNFVHHPTKEWAAQNIDTALSTFGTDAAWVYATSNKLIYYSSASGDASATNIALPPAAFAKLTKDHFDHFYVREPSGLMEIRAATIVPTSDYAHTSLAQGFWIVGRYINGTYLSKMSDLAQSKLTLEPDSFNPADKATSSAISFGIALPGWDGQSLGVLKLNATVPLEQDLENLYSRELILLVLFFVASAILIIMSLWLLVLRPVKRITGALQEQKPESLDGMSISSTEFGNLAQVVQLSFRQKLKIDESEFIKARLEELNKAKGEFLAIAAHELRGPVGNINIFVKSLSEDLQEKKITPITVGTELERIGQQAHKANVLINDMYQASKGGRVLDFQKKEFNFDDFIRSEVENAQFSTHQEIELKGSTGQKIASDPDRLGQVMTNLVRNAAKYSPADSKIIVRMSYAENSVHVEVQDFGLGISPEDQAHVFQRFYRSSRVAKDYPGLGLGLSVCKEIIEGLGGRLWFVSQLGAGSQFHFTLPAHDSNWSLS